MEEKIYQSKNGKVHYWLEKCDKEDALCLIFLHGLLADHTLFELQYPYFKGKCTMLSWDAPAHGLSRPYKNFTYPNAADDLNAILEQHKIRKCVMIGQSMGGYIIQTFMKKYARKVEGFIGIDTCPFGLKYYSKSDMWWLRQMEWMCSLYPKGVLKRSIAKSCTQAKVAYNNMYRAVSHYEKKELCHLAGIGYAGFLEANFDLKIECPVLLLVGENDRTGKVKKYCEEWHLSEGYPLHIIPNAAHNSNIDNPETVNSQIDIFVKTLEAKKKMR